MNIPKKDDGYNVISDGINLPRVKYTEQDGSLFHVNFNYFRFINKR